MIPKRLLYNFFYEIITLKNREISDPLILLYQKTR